MTKNLGRRAGQRLKMGLQVREQKVERAPMMIMRDHPSRDAPEPFDAVGIGSVPRKPLL